MPNNRISIDKLADAIMAELDDYTYVCDAVVQKAVDQTADELVEELQHTSPKRTGKYAQSWSADSSGRPKSHKASKTVYSTAPYYRLTHLLEKGHASVNGGRVDPIVHIQPAATDAESLLIKHIKEGIE